MGGGWEVNAASAASFITIKRCYWMVVGWEVDAASAVSVITSKQSGHRCKTQS
jgi:hypothetical protein